MREIIDSRGRRLRAAPAWEVRLFYRDMEADFWRRVIGHVTRNELNGEGLRLVERIERAFEQETRG